MTRATMFREMGRDVNQKVASSSTCDDLKRMYNFTDIQLNMCYDHIDSQTGRSELMDAVAFAARTGVQLCASVMRHRRWNCPNRLDAANGPIFGTTESHGATREAAFVRAVMTATLSYRIIQKCSDPNRFLKTCSCDRTKAYRDYIPTGPNDRLSKQRFAWDSCSDNVAFGNRFARVFADSEIESRESMESLTERWNSGAGAQAVADVSAYALCCRCHGLSGSCLYRTCWICVPNILVIGQKLKEQYDNAIRVKRDGDSAIIARQEKQKEALSDRSLVFANKSPDYCTQVTGRKCNSTTTKGEGSCEELCCGRGYTVTKEIQLAQDCKFVWCCRMECSTKLIPVHVPRCN